MTSIHDNSATDPSSHTPPGIEPAEVERALATILADDKFAAAPQMSAFLAYVVKQTLRGEADRIKAYTVAVDALGKPATFDPQNDPSVRVLAKRLRSSIDQYYGRTFGHGVVIELKSGSYKPRFVRAENLERALGEAGTGSAHAEGSAIARDEQSDTESSTGAAASATNNEVVALSAAGSNTHGNAGALQHPQAEVHSPSGTEHAFEAQGRSGTPAANPAGPPGPRRGLTAALRRLPHPAMTAITVLAIGWGVTQHQQESRLRSELTTIANDNGLIMGEQPLQIALASSSDGHGLRTRPTLPTVHLPAMQDQSALEDTLGASITRVLSGFENIEVIRQNTEAAVQWPEDYTLHFSDYSLGDRVRVEAQLLQGATGRVVSVDTFDLPDLTHDTITEAELAGIEAFAAKLAQLNGPLVRDYLAQRDLSPAVACALGADPATLTTDKGSTGTVEGNRDDDIVANRNAADTAIAMDAFDCDRSTAGDAQTATSRLATRAVMLLDSLQGLSGTAREHSLDQALALAQQAVEHEPFSAAAHTVLMNTLQEKGRHDEALMHGNQALEFNRFDTRTLRSVARVMDSLQLSEDSATLRTEATRLDPVKTSSIALNNG